MYGKLQLAARLQNCAHPMLLLAPCWALLVACGPQDGGSTGATATASGAVTAPPSAAIVPGAKSTAAGSTAPARTAQPSKGQGSASARVRPKSTARYAPLSDDDVKTLVTPHLGSGEALAHQVFRGPFGPSQDTIVVLTKRDVAGVTKFGGFLLYQVAGKTTKLALPDLHDNWAGSSIDAVAFMAEADADRVEEVVIVASYISGAGPEAAKPFHSTTVIDVNGQQVNRLTEMESLAGTSDNLGVIRKLFRSKTFVLRLDGARQMIAPTLGRTTAVTRLQKLLGVEPTVNTDARVEFAYGADKSMHCNMSFNDQAKLTAVEVNATGGEPNATLVALRGWLKRKRIKASKDAAGEQWKYNGWNFSAPTKDKAGQRLLIKPAN